MGHRVQITKLIIVNPKSEYRNPKQIQNLHPVESSEGGPPTGSIPQGRFSNVPNKNSKANSGLFRFGHLNFDHSDLPFDVAQGGELVEPFRASNLGIRILSAVCRLSSVV